MKSMHSNTKVLINIYKDKLQTCFNIHQATLCLPLQKIVIIYTDDTGYVPFVEVTIGSFPHS
jgi:hypothetical protein